MMSGSVSCGRYITGVTYSRPLERPGWCSRTSGAPSNVPPTLPSFARNSSMVFAFQSLISNSCRSRIGVLEGPTAAEAGKGPLHGEERPKERDSAANRCSGQLGARLTKQFAGNRSRREDRFHEIANVRGVLDDRLGVLVSLVDDALGLMVVEVDHVLKRSDVLGPHDVHDLRAQAFELLDFPLVKLDPSDALYLTHSVRASIVGDPVRCADRNCPALSSAATASSRIG